MKTSTAAHQLNYGCLMLNRRSLKQISFFALASAFVASNSIAATGFNPRIPGFKPEDVSYTVRQLFLLNGPTANCNPAGNCQAEAMPSQACTSAYGRLYPADKTDLDFRIFVSYWDTQPEPASPGMPASPRTDIVIDHMVKDMFSSILLQPCYDGLYACGFARERENEDTRELEHLTKTITGPDGKTRTVHLSLESTSVSDSNLANHHENKAAQSAQSKKTADDFFDSLGKADVVLYTGHARWGTGPGFKAVPSKLSWSWFDQGIFKPSRRRLEKALRSASEKPAVIGYFACTSEKYYSKTLEKSAPDTGLALTEVPTSDMESQEDTLGTLNALLGLQCEEDFRKTLRSDTDGTDAEIIDFFKP